MIKDRHSTTTRGKTHPTTIIKGEHGEVIELPFPEEKFNHHLKKVGTANEQELTNSRLAALMINVIADFKKGAMSLDEVSEIFNYLFWEGWYKDHGRYSELGDILENGAELSYYLRHAVDNGEPNSTFVEFLYSLMQFYDRRAVVRANVESMEKERS